MGQRGPKPLPGNVHLLRGNPSKKPISALSGAVEPDVEIPNCPRHLLPEARKEWRRITPELERLGLIAQIDRTALALYCQAYARWVWCEEQLQRAIALSALKKAEFEAAEAAKVDAAAARGEVYVAAGWNGGDGFMLPTPNGSFTYSPHWVGANKAMEQVDKFLASFGMSPSSRGRVTASSRQMTLPGVPDAATGFNSL